MPAWIQRLQPDERKLAEALHRAFVETGEAVWE